VKCPNKILQTYFLPNCKIRQQDTNIEEINSDILFVKLQNKAAKEKY
jgi:hypothetical protein